MATVQETVISGTRWGKTRVQECGFAANTRPRIHLPTGRPPASRRTHTAPQEAVKEDQHESSAPRGR